MAWFRVHCTHDSRPDMWLTLQAIDRPAAVRLARFTMLTPAWKIVGVTQLED